MKDSREVSQLKKKIMKTTCFLLYGVEEMTLLTYILNVSDEKPQMKVLEIQNIFSDADKLLAGLKGSRMIQSKDSSTFYVNHDYFKMVPAVHRQFTKKLNQTIKEIESDAQKVSCKRCGKKRSKDEVNFFSCDCGGKQVIVLNTDNSKNNIDTIKMLLSQLNQISEWNDEIKQYRQIESRNVQYLGKKEKNERKVTNIQQDIKLMGEYLAKQKNRHPEMESIWPGVLEPKYHTLMQAMNQFQPNRKFHKIEELRKVREKRREKEKNKIK